VLRRITNAYCVCFCGCYRHVIATTEVAEKQLKDLWVYTRLSQYFLQSISLLQLQQNMLGNYNQ